MGTVWSYSSGTQWYEHTSDHDYLGIWNENHRDDHSVYLTGESGTERQGSTARIDLYLAQVVTCSDQCNSSTITEVTRIEVPTSPSSEDFQKFEGMGCRASDGRKGSQYTGEFDLYQRVDMDSCRIICLGDDLCHGFEVSRQGRCEIWKVSIDEFQLVQVNRLDCHIKTGHHDSHDETQTMAEQIESDGIVLTDQDDYDDHDDEDNHLEPDKEVEVDHQSHCDPYKGLTMNELIDCEIKFHTPTVSPVPTASYSPSTTPIPSYDLSIKVPTSSPVPTTATPPPFGFCSNTGKRRCCRYVPFDSVPFLAS